MKPAKKAVRSIAAGEFGPWPDKQNKSHLNRYRTSGDFYRIKGLC